MSLEEALFISHRGRSACYFIDEHKKTFGTALADRAIQRPEEVAEWAHGLISQTDHILGHIEDLKKEEATKENFDLFIRSMYEYGVYHRMVKVSVDYLPQEILDKYLQTLTEARVHAEPVYEATESYMQYFASAIGAAHNLRPELVLAMTKKQFLAFLEDSVVPDQSLLEKQYEGSILYLSLDQEQYVSGNEVPHIEEKLFETSNKKELRGQSAYGGLVRGTARVIMDASVVEEFNEGDILVTGMTRPEFLPIMKKAGAVVTDAGGILSHAAITARELKKPCVIATETSTKVIKTGDLIEVDAEKGIITVLKKANN